MAPLTRLLTSLLIFFSALPPLSAQTRDRSYGEDFNHEFSRILVDARGSRGGNGDVAAAYFIANDLITRYKSTAVFTILVDPTSEKILKNIARGNPDFLSQVRLVSAKNLKETDTFNLYLAMAGPSGEFRYGDQIIYPATGFKAWFYKYAWWKKIRMEENAVMISQPVLGNTENNFSRFTKARVRVVQKDKSRSYSMRAAGIGPLEAGSYPDYVARALRGKSKEEVRQYLLDQINFIGDKKIETPMGAILKSERLQGAKVGLLYGVSAYSTRKQFEKYLQGLAATGESYCLFTPSLVNLANIKDPELRSRVKILKEGEELPANAEAGQIYILLTKNLPHTVFVGLTAFAQKNDIVPLGAGDGFLSAAIELGEPFVTTRVEHNRKNNRALLQRLFDISTTKSRDLRELLVDVFSNSELDRAQEFSKYQNLFWGLRKEIPDLTEEMVRFSILAKEQALRTQDQEKRIAEKAADEALDARKEKDRDNEYVISLHLTCDRSLRKLRSLVK